MKRVLLILWIVLTAAGFSHAGGNGTEELVPVSALLKYSGSRGDGPLSGTAADIAYPENHADTAARFALHDEMDIASRGYIEWSGAATGYDAPPRNAPRPLVYNISVVSAKEKAGHQAPDTGSTSPAAGALQLGAAFLTNLAVHEFGHAVVADYVGATGSKLDFFTRQGDQFFLGTSTVEDIDEKSRLPYRAGGEFFADLTFEHALRNYRKNATTFNKSLMLVSGTDFLWYCFYSFYLSEGHPDFDPVGISRETGISRDTLFFTVMAKTAINAYRVYSGTDYVIPYVSVDRYSASLNLAIPFNIDSFIMDGVFMKPDL